MNLTRTVYTVAAILILTLASCTYVSQGIWVASDRNASLSQLDSFGDSAERVVYPKQNWSKADSLWFYNITQGSNLMPYEMFLHLEVADGEELFRSDGHINRLRYLPQRPSFANPDGLPIGWVKDTYQGKSYVGFTCAACHTGQLNYQGTAIRIDGAPALADMDLMLKSLAAALDAAANNEAKFARLAKKVLGAQYQTTKDRFYAELRTVAEQINRYNYINAPLHGNQTVAYGYSRLDAFGRIYNRILAFLNPLEITFNPANAPVNYPYLWDTPQHDFVQWNGIGDNESIGPLGRNVGQALGVFASLDLHRQPGDVGFRSSVVVRNLSRIEGHLESLWSPKWKDLSEQKALPPIDLTLANEGRAVYNEYQCHSCHETIDRTDPDRRIIAQFSTLETIGTDPHMAKNAISYTGKSGYFEGYPIRPWQPNSPLFMAVTPMLAAVGLATMGALVEVDHDKSLIRRWAEQVYDLTASLFRNSIKKTERYVNFQKVDKHDPASLAVYKARPLNGIWATAPYLHNGSVPNLYELFLPSCSDAESLAGKTCRSNDFTLGAREFDPVKVGFVQRSPLMYPDIFVFDTRLPGNSNKGHEYTSGVTPVFLLDDHGNPIKDEDGNAKMRRLEPISEAKRLALVEYLKTL